MASSSSPVKSCSTKLFFLTVDIFAPCQSRPHLTLLRIGMIVMVMMVVVLLLMMVKVTIEKTITNM